MTNGGARRLLRSKRVVRVVIGGVVAAWLLGAVVALQLPEADLQSSRWNIASDIFGSTAAVAALIIAFLALERYNEQDFVQAEQALQALATGVYEPYRVWPALLGDLQAAASTSRADGATVETLRARLLGAIDVMTSSPDVGAYWRPDPGEWPGCPRARKDLTSCRGRIAGATFTAVGDAADEQAPPTATANTLAEVDQLLSVDPGTTNQLFDAIRSSWPSPNGVRDDLGQADAPLQQFLGSSSFVAHYPNEQRALRDATRFALTVDEAFAGLSF